MKIVFVLLCLMSCASYNNRSPAIEEPTARSEFDTYKGHK